MPAGRPVLPMLGKVFSQWTVIGESDIKSKNGDIHWTCKCTCGNISHVGGSSLRNGTSTKCGTCSAYARTRQANYAKSKDRPVYFLRSGEYVKIGASDNIPSRMRVLQAHNPTELELLETFENLTEQAWHEIFSHRHHRGEWFHFPISSMV